MKRILAAVGLAACCLTWTAPARSQPVPDHLKCYKVKDPQAKATYTADLGGLVAEPRCTIKVPAVMACVPATKTNVNPNPPGSGGTGTPNAFGCYKVKCPKATLPAFQLNDQFGSRAVTPITPKLLCAPLAPPTTTTTTTVLSTTTTTGFPGCAVAGSSCGGCGNGVCLVHCGSPSIGFCVSGCSGTCVDDSGCGPGTRCMNTIGTPSGCAMGACCGPCS